MLAFFYVGHVIQSKSITTFGNTLLITKSDIHIPADVDGGEDVVIQREYCIPDLIPNFDNTWCLYIFHTFRYCYMHLHDSKFIIFIL